VSLYKDEFLGRLENENRLAMGELCTPEDKECVAKALAPETDDIPVYDSPGGKPIATLKVIYTPGKGISAALAQGNINHPYVPPVFDSDWGYGPWFHATLLAAAEPAWKQIALPGITAGWVELPASQAITMTGPGVYIYKDRQVIVVKSGENDLTLRDEQEADMWCEAGNPPPLKDFKTRDVPVRDFYDGHCQLLIAPAYTRGC
jgi:hypothetical protein